MASNLEEQLIEKVRALPAHKQHAALRLLDILEDAGDDSANGSNIDFRPMSEIAEEVNADLPADTWDNVPTDGSINLDHHLYGAPKRQP